MQPITSPSPPESETREPSPRAALISLSLTLLLSSLGTSIANIALPNLTLAFSASFQDVQWVVLAYLLTLTSMIVSVGKLGDLSGRRRLLLAGIALFALASLASGLADSLLQLILARAAQGIGAAAMMALTLAFVSEIVPKDKMGSAMGLLGTTSAIGTALGPSLGGALIASFSWRAIFLINLPLGLLAFALVLRHLPQDRRTKTQSSGFDPYGAVLLTVTLCAYALAMTLGRGHFGWLNLALLALSLGGTLLFVYVENKVASPLIHLHLFRDPLFHRGLTMSALVSTVVMATLVVGPFYLAAALHLAPVQIGLVMTSGPLVSALTGLPAGRLVDRWGHNKTTLAGLMLMALATSVLPIMPLRAAVLGYMLPLMVLTAGYALFQAANNTAIMADLKSEQRGTFAGMLNLFRNLGLITGASLMGAVFAHGTGTQNLASASPEAVADGMRLSFAVAAALIFVALGLALSSRVSTGQAQNTGLVYRT